MDDSVDDSRLTAWGDCVDCVDLFCPAFVGVAALKLFCVDGTVTEGTRIVVGALR